MGEGYVGVCLRLQEVVRGGFLEGDKDHLADARGGLFHQSFVLHVCCGVVQIKHLVTSFSPCSLTPHHNVVMVNGRNIFVQQSDGLKCVTHLAS